jgi:cell division protease FtsH
MSSDRWMKGGLVYLLIIVGVIAVFFTILSSLSGPEERTIDQVLTMARSTPPQIKEIEVSGQELTGTLVNGEKFSSRIGQTTDILELLSSEGIKVGAGESGISVRFKTPGGMGSFIGIFISFLPLIFFGGLILFMMRQAQGTNSQTMSFGQSKAKLFVANKPNVTFADVAGVDEAKYELEEIVEFLKYPERFLALGARIPRGVLLVGPPGVGKTLLARAVAGEAGVPFFSISGSEFVEMFVGVGAARVRDLFEQAKRNAPCIVFVDEIDAVGRHRGAGLGGGHDEREQTLNQILVEMDGFDTSINIIVVAATNRPDILDPALLRPGRFDRRVTLDLPDIAGRKAIFEVHSKGKPFAPDSDSDVIAKQTPGLSGADLANLVNESALLAARANKHQIGLIEVEEAIDRLVAGPERKSRIINQREKEMTAYHEAGHALVAWTLPHADKVHKISIVSRGNMGGYTRLLPSEDRFLWTKNQFDDMLATAMGGRVAEELVFTEITTGASNDIETATKMALSMIKRYGMSENLGPRTFGRREELVFLGREISEQRDYGDKVAEEIDQEVKAIIHRAYERANSIISTNRSTLNRVTRYLLKHETVEGEKMEHLFNNDLDPDDEVRPAETSTPPPTSSGTPLVQPSPAMSSRHDPNAANPDTSTT